MFVRSFLIFDYLVDDFDNKPEYEEHNNIRSPKVRVFRVSFIIMFNSREYSKLSDQDQEISKSLKIEI